MRKLVSKHKVGTVLRALRFLAIRLRSRPQSTPLVPEAQATRNRLRTAHDGWLDAREERIAATAELVYLDEVVDVLVMLVVRATLVLVGGRRQDPRYVKLFPQSPSELLLGITSERQARFILTLAALLESDPEYVTLAHYAPQLREALATLQAAIATRDARYVPEAQAQAELTQRLDEARRFYNLLAARLTLLFPDDPHLVDSFFLPLDVKRGSSSKAAGTSPEPAGEELEDEDAGDE